MSHISWTPSNLQLNQNKRVEETNDKSKEQADRQTQAVGHKVLSSLPSSNDTSQLEDEWIIVASSSHQKTLSPNESESKQTESERKDQETSSKTHLAAQKTLQNTGDSSNRATSKILFTVSTVTDKFKERQVSKSGRCFLETTISEIHKSMIHREYKVTELIKKTKIDGLYRATDEKGKKVWVKIFYTLLTNEVENFKKIQHSPEYAGLKKHIPYIDSGTYSEENFLVAEELVGTTKKEMESAGKWSDALQKQLQSILNQLQKLGVFIQPKEEDILVVGNEKTIKILNLNSPNELEIEGEKYTFVSTIKEETYSTSYLVTKEKDSKQKFILRVVHSEDSKEPDNFASLHKFTQSPYIPRFFGAGTIAGRRCFLLEYVEGVTMRTVQQIRAWEEEHQKQFEEIFALVQNFHWENFHFPIDFPSSIIVTSKEELKLWAINPPK